MAIILHLVCHMRIQRTLIRVICSGVVFGSVVGARPSLSVPPPSIPTPTQSRLDCEEWEHRTKDVDDASSACASRKTFRVEEELSDRSREEEQEGLHWQPLEPTERDLSLWYYPGAPRPLWGY